MHVICLLLLRRVVNCFAQIARETSSHTKRKTAAELSNLLQKSNEERKQRKKIKKKREGERERENFRRISETYSFGTEHKRAPRFSAFDLLKVLLLESNTVLEDIKPLWSSKVVHQDKR